MYTENLLHLLNLLEISGQSGTLTCSLSANVEKTSWQACCFLNEGKIQEINIHNSADGKILLEGHMALEWLKTQGGLYWQFKETLLPDALPIRPARPKKPDIVPRRTTLGARLGVRGMSAHTWSREHRTVFLLIDGVRSQTEIMRLLSTYSEKDITMILADLKSGGLIE